MADLTRYEDASYIREATEEETAASIAAAKVDGGVGAITVQIEGEDVTCYVVSEEERIAFISFQHPDNGIPCTVEYWSDGTLTLEDEAEEFNASADARAEIETTRARLAGQICTDLAAATCALREEGVIVAREGGWNV
jgi:hypothetical protein